jgi:DNA repair protein SbcD/Mre11
LDSFTFLHAADLHLGSPLAGLAVKDEAIAKRFANASREAFTTLIDKALDAKVAFAIIAGDVYDGPWQDVGIGQFFVGQIARLANASIPVYLLKGNHDAESLIVRSLPAPNGVATFAADAPQTFRIEALRVALHGQSYAVRDVTGNLAAGYPQKFDGWLNIGVLHTGLSGRAGHAPYAPCGTGDLVRKGYDYWALGHIHAYEEVRRGDPWIVYPGNLQGRNVSESGAKGAVLVDVKHGRIEGVRRVIVDRARWLTVDAELSGAESAEDFQFRVRRALELALGEQEAQLYAVRIRAIGQTRLHRTLMAGHRSHHEDAQTLARTLAADVWIEKLEIATSEMAGTDTTLAELVLGPALLSAASDPAMTAEARRLVEAVTHAAPASFDFSGLGDPEELIAEARALALHRAGAAP